MYKTPLILGIDSLSCYRQGLSEHQLLENCGNNTGNIIFSEAVFRTLNNVRRSTYAFSNEDASQADVIVIAAANWLNPYSDFGDLADRLESTKLPVVIVGLGAQSNIDHEIPAINPGTLKLVRLASERSNMISVRGDFTKEVLHANGIENVQSTGCPSLLLSGANPPDIDITRLQRPVVLHSTRHLLDLASPYQLKIYREAYKQGLDLILQSELADLIVQRDCQSEDSVAAIAVLDKVYDTREIVSLSGYLKERGKFFFNLDEWLGYLRNAGPCIGTRIHGTVAALLAGTPAVLIAHDSRTREMAQKMAIPYLLSSDVTSFDSQYLRDIAAKADYGDLRKKYKDYAGEFIRFFEKNNLQVTEQFTCMARPTASEGTGT